MNTDRKEIEELPNGWVLCRSKSNPGRQYYFNRKTGKSSWTPPQFGDKPDKNANARKKEREKEKASQEKRKRDEARNKSLKRRSDGSESGSSKKKSKNDTPEKHHRSSSNKESPKKTDSKVHTDIYVAPTKLKFESERPRSSTPRKSDSFLNDTPTKNLASTRLSQLRAQLSTEAQNDIVDESPKKRKTSPKPVQNETPLKSKSIELYSPILGESSNTTPTKSPTSDSLQSNESPSQFFAANKIICSMKAQLLEEYSKKEKTKDTFADIEHGICNQMTDYPVIKHPSTPPQFSEASKLVSAIKSKLAYKVLSPKDVKTFTSAKDRMEALRASISGEVDERDLQEEPRKSTSPQKCEAMEVEYLKEVTKSTDPYPKDKDSDNNQVVLVVDTNIFIHELDFIKNVLNAHIKGYSEQPMLLVPWRVINELDRLKDNNNGSGALCKRARAAMDYLYKSLPENNRIKGQSLRDANSHIYPCEVADDEILNCSLQQAERGKNVLLLSNDRNLCNKASINGIKRVGIAELKALLHEQPTSRADPGMLPRYRRYQSAIHHLLANILENEMRAKYNDLWQHVVFKAPPWQLTDVLQCLLKHWVAVFGEVFPRIEHLIADLSSVHRSIESKDPKAVSSSEVNAFREACAEVARRCQIIPEYMELAKAAAAQLEPASPARDQDHMTQLVQDQPSARPVVEAFEALWTVVSSYCAKLSTALGIPHTLEDHMPGNERLIDLTSKFLAFNTCIVNLVLAIKRVLSIEETPSMDEKTARLETVFRDALKVIQREGYFTGGCLREFCATNSNMLQEALNKFSELARVLDMCKNRLPSSINS